MLPRDLAGVRWWLVLGVKVDTSIKQRHQDTRVLQTKFYFPGPQFKVSTLFLLLNIGLCRRLVSGCTQGRRVTSDIRYQPRPDIGVTISAQTCAPPAQPSTKMMMVMVFLDEHHYTH